MKGIDVNDLTFSYDQKQNAVEHVSFSIPKGSYTTIIGQNGSGKSTVAKLLLGLLEKNGGEIRIDDMELNEENIRTIRRKVGIVFQNPDNQFIGSTVRDDIAFGLENHSIPQREMDSLIDTFSKKVGMEEFLNAEPMHLSGGQKQRVAIAGVLAMHPEFLLFDEATSMLDPQGKEEIKNVIRHLHSEKELTILSITHDIDEVAYSDYVIAMYQGRAVMTGTPEEIFADEKAIQKIHLDLPFSIRMGDALCRHGVPVNKSITRKGLVEQLCRLHSNM
ncbi:MAG: energy-coupling factor transporter ATPase [Bulleidia sp.]